MKPDIMKYIFVGDRHFVLNEMRKQNLHFSEIFVMANSYLERKISHYPCNYKIIHSKNELLDKIEKTNFDIMLSNECPYILPISKMKPKQYINIHPSFLPDLRGKHAINGSILLKRDSGATCHYMDDGINTGDIITQVKIPYSDDLDAALLYHLAFQAENQVFKLALEKKFQPLHAQETTKNSIYYSSTSENLPIQYHTKQPKYFAKNQSWRLSSISASLSPF